MHEFTHASLPSSFDARLYAFMPQCLLMTRWIALTTLYLASSALSIGGCGMVAEDMNEVFRMFTMPSPAEAARDMLDPYNPDRRREGLVLIAQSPFGGEDVYVRTYRDYVQNEPDPTVRAAAIRALGRTGRVEDAVLIADQLDHADVQVRWAAVEALQRIHNPVVVARLITVLRDSEEHVDVRSGAAIALGQYREDRVFHALIDALETRHLSVNHMAKRSLGLMTGQDFAMDRRPWLEWYDAMDDPFADGREYHYPTYQRGPTFFERLVFWYTPYFEQPGVPIGLRPETERQTYPDE